MPFFVAKSPVRDANVIGWYDVPFGGTNPPVSAMFSVPSSVAAPLMAKTSYCVPELVPPMSMSIVPVDVCVYVPLIVSVPMELPGVIVPPFVTFAVTVPAPPRVPPLSISGEPLTVSAPPFRPVDPADCVKPLWKASVPLLACAAPVFVNGG